jgi:hypothetical protein
LRKANWGPLRWRGPGCSTRSGVFGPCPPIILRWWCRVSAPLRPPCCSASFCARPVQNSGGVAMAAMEHPWRLNVSPACMQGCGNREIADPWASWADPGSARDGPRVIFGGRAAPSRAAAPTAACRTCLRARCPCMDLPSTSCGPQLAIVRRSRAPASRARASPSAPETPPKRQLASASLARRGAVSRANGGRSAYVTRGIKLLGTPTTEECATAGFLPDWEICTLDTDQQI